jgi:hypothetical protein
VREGTSGDTFYIISEGDVRVTQTKVSTKLFEQFRETHKVLIYKEHHCVGPLVGIGTPPTPLPQASGPSSPDPKGGGREGTLACG